MFSGSGHGIPPSPGQYGYPSPGQLMPGMSPSQMMMMNMHGSPVNHGMTQLQYLQAQQMQLMAQQQHAQMMMRRVSNASHASGMGSNNNSGHHPQQHFASHGSIGSNSGHQQYYTTGGFAGQQQMGIPFAPPLSVSNAQPMNTVSNHSNTIHMNNGSNHSNTMHMNSGSNHNNTMQSQPMNHNHDYDDGHNNRNDNHDSGDMDPLPLESVPSAEINWNEDDDMREQGLLDGVGAHEHRMSSLSCLPDGLPDEMDDDDIPQEEQYQREQEKRAFSKQQDFVNREHDNYGSHESIPDDEEPIRPDFGRNLSIGSVDIAACMGESTGSLFDTLRVEAVPEGDDEDNEPLSPKRSMFDDVDVDPRYTPVVSNRVGSAGRGTANEGDPATVTPTPSSPAQARPKHTMMQMNNSFLDDDVLKAWANTDSDDDGIAFAIGTSPFGGSSQGAASAPFRRANTVEGHGRVPRDRGATSPFRRTNTNPKLPGSPKIPARRLPRKTQTSPERAQSPTNDPQLSPRPNAITKEKRMTSNVAETPETRKNLAFQDRPHSIDENPNSRNCSDASDISSFSSTFMSVKKASLNRDKSAQSHLLKQKYMPHVYGSPSNQSNATISTMSTSSGHNGWPTGACIPLPFASSPTSTAPHSPTRSPPNEAADSNVAGSNITPTTSKVMKDFGNMNLVVNAQNDDERNKASKSRTAQSFEGTFDSRTAEAASKLPMDLMVKKPERLMWRNRTSTIDALVDLDCLDEDPVLKEEQGGSKR